MLQEREGIKFNSIYFRYYLWILATAVMVMSIIIGVDAYTGWGENREIITVGQLCFILNITFSAIYIGCSFAGWKMSVCRNGIYIKKIDLFVPWDEITGVSHVWINDYNRIRGGYFLYNRKTIVIYRKDTKPICIYNISLFALWAVKLYTPSLKTNLISATAATVVNVILSGTVFCFGYGLNLKYDLFYIYFIWLVLYFIKCVSIPLIMVITQNRIWGPYLHHATAYQRNSSDVINI